MDVLVVDDSALNRLVLRRLVHAAGGSSVVEASCGQSAYAACKASSFPLVLMDLNMPVMDGWQATEHIRLLERARGLRPGRGAAFIVAVTSEDVSHGSPALQKCWQCGMDAVMGKSVTLDNVAELLRLACTAAAGCPRDEGQAPARRSSLDCEPACLPGRLQQMLDGGVFVQ
ncbi:hypothetical protein CHLNCDRAFT_144976 [Chlorella variabilis]|uniref:histidine kinase n=1 Tax=Chlorella variabilis TaxID=554065 RepID=E1ZDE8_CHLVA|nr:hypothetical protein CHLNCDRAFT_144976 [Chlorella variabilis]EFN56212.1 hypothetical protein CHLNCDRAFT_144976 [Chlorella variabilis]|eukprot:XP_005848314.1 hypothetical protein CHLNCDRAFT_144976 [Chlorella variabilis]